MRGGRIVIVTPGGASPGGNRTTAERWARLLRGLGHEVAVASAWAPSEPADVLVALHARRSATSALAFARSRPGAALVVAAAGTDVNVRRLDPRALEALSAARRIVALNPLAVRALPPRLRGRARVVLQSAEPPARAPQRARDRFDVAVVANLRFVKDPLRAALAARALPADSRIRVVHAGVALSDALARRAARESATNPRYRWVGPLPHARALRLVARSHALVVASRSEGGANVVSEAVVADTLVVASRTDGNVGLLGEDWPALFDVGATRELRDLLVRLERDATLRADLARRTRTLARSFRPAAEAAAWRRLLAELRGPSTVSGPDPSPDHS